MRATTRGSRPECSKAKRQQRRVTTCAGRPNWSQLCCVLRRKNGRVAAFYHHLCAIFYWWAMLPSPDARDALSDWCHCSCVCSYGYRCFICPSSDSSSSGFSIVPDQMRELDRVRPLFYNTNNMIWFSWLTGWPTFAETIAVVVDAASISGVGSSGCRWLRSRCGRPLSPNTCLAAFAYCYCDRDRGSSDVRRRT